MVVYKRHQTRLNVTMNQQLKGWRLINMAACPFSHILIHLNYCNPGVRSPRLCFPGDNKSPLSALIEMYGSECPPVTHAGHHITTTCFLNVRETQRKRERVLQKHPLNRGGKTFCRAICVLPGREPGPCYHSIIYKSLKTSANSASWLRLQELLC